MVGPEVLLIDRKSAAVESFGLLDPTCLLEHAGKVVEYAGEKGAVVRLRVGVQAHLPIDLLRLGKPIGLTEEHGKSILGLEAVAKDVGDRLLQGDDAAIERLRLRQAVGLPKEVGQTEKRAADPIVTLGKCNTTPIDLFGLGDPV